MGEDDEGAFLVTSGHFTSRGFQLMCKIFIHFASLEHHEGTVRSPATMTRRCESPPAVQRGTNPEISRVVRERISRLVEREGSCFGPVATL